MGPPGASWGLLGPLWDFGLWDFGLGLDNLERVQKAALKVILGKDYNDYDEALKLLNIQSLEQRREVISLRFIKNSLKNANFSKLIPLKRLIMY